METLHCPEGSSSILLTDTKAKKNAIDPDWPDFLKRCDYTLLINAKGQMAL